MFTLQRLNWTVTLDVFDNEVQGCMTRNFELTLIYGFMAFGILFIITKELYGIYREWGRPIKFNRERLELLLSSILMTCFIYLLYIIYANDINNCVTTTRVLKEQGDGMRMHFPFKGTSFMGKLKVVSTGSLPSGGSEIREEFDIVKGELNSTCEPEPRDKNMPIGTYFRKIRFQMADGRSMEALYGSLHYMNEEMTQIREPIVVNGDIKDKCELEYIEEFVRFVGRELKLPNIGHNARAVFDEYIMLLDVDDGVITLRYP